MERTHVEDQNPALENSPMDEDSDTLENALEMAADDVYCKWNGEDYSHGAEVCSNHRIYSCFDGRWVRGVGGC